MLVGSGFRKIARLGVKGDYMGVARNKPVRAGFKTGG